MDGFTGLDIERAEHDIDEFFEACSCAYSEMSISIENLAETLAMKWASPVAVEFSKEYNEKMEYLFTDFRTAYWHICSGASEAGRTLAIANGAFWDYDMDLEPGSIRESGANFFSCKEELYGVTGMDTESVRVALETFNTAISAGLSDLDAVPDNIGFYDPNGQLVGSYNRNITEFKTKFRELFDDISDYIYSALYTETDNILLAKEQAAQAMNG